jgi:hypothetical protein
MTTPDAPAKLLAALDRLRNYDSRWTDDYLKCFAILRTGIAELTRERDAARNFIDWLQGHADEGWDAADEASARAEAAEARVAELEKDAGRLDYIEHTFSGMTNRERYLPVQMIWGKGCNGRTLRDACDKYMKRDAAIDALAGQP